MSKDYWANSDQVFVHYGKCYGVNKKGETVCLGEEKDIVDTSMPDISKLKVIDTKSHSRIRRKK